MQKRVYNAVRALVESTNNPIKLIHDHGAGGHMNCLAELLEETGGRVDVDQFPVGDKTLSVREILSNESQERMGLIMAKEDLNSFKEICERERAPVYLVGEVTEDGQLEFSSSEGSAVSLPVDALLGASPKTVLEDEPLSTQAPAPVLDLSALSLEAEVTKILSLEGVACKDWLTNKVDRSVTGLVAQQQCVGPLGLALSNLGAMAMDYSGRAGVVTAMGSRPVPGLVDSAVGSRLSIAEALTNIVWAPIKNGLEGVVLSANWMWPAKQPGENERLYRGVEAASKFACALGVSIPTGKDSLSMTMNYADGEQVLAPGTVVVSASAECEDVCRIVTPDLKAESGSKVFYINASGQIKSALGGSALYQCNGVLGDQAPDVESVAELRRVFSFIQSLVQEEKLLAGHDVSDGGLITTLLEMCFAGDIGMNLKLEMPEAEAKALLFSEKPGLVIQLSEKVAAEISGELKNVDALELGVVGGEAFELKTLDSSFSAYVSGLRDTWFKPSSLLDREQTAGGLSEARLQNYANQGLQFNVRPSQVSGQPETQERKIKAGIIREKGTNGDREMAYALYLAGFEVRDIAMPDLMSGRETLEELSFIAFPGGFSNSDVLGAAKGWAGAFLHNENAMTALKSFVGRDDTLSLGVCNGCQLMAQLGLLTGELGSESKLRLLENHSQKFESSFLTVEVEESPSIMLKPLEGQRLGIWVAHGEGRFELQEPHQISMKYAFSEYPANPNGSNYNAAAVVSSNGRHLAMMPHLERSIFGWQWAYLGDSGLGKRDKTPWLEAFSAARSWLEK